MFTATNKQKGYTFFDIIEITQALFDGIAIDILNKVWKVANEWATHKWKWKIVSPN